MTEGGDLLEAPAEGEAPKKKWNKYSSKAKQEAARTELATLVSTLLVFGTLAWKAPETIKPNGDELNAVGFHLSGIIGRHIDISSVLTKDMLDVIGIMAVTAAYLSRINPEMKRLRGGGNEPPPGPPRGPTIFTPPPPSGEEMEMPVSPDTRAFLNRIGRSVEE